MATLAQLHQGVRAVLASNRIGKPVFVRYHLQGLLDNVLPDLAQLAAEVNGWMGQAAHTLYSLESGKGGPFQYTLEMRYPGGECAILSMSRNAPSQRGASVLVLGNRGAMTHTLDGVTPHLWKDAVKSPFDRRVPTLLAALEAMREKGTNPIRVAQGEVTTPAAPKPPPKPKPQYGVLLVTGAHTHQENYAAAFAADPRCRLIALTDDKDIDARRRRLNERLARELGVPYVADLAEALKNPDVHLVSICAEPERRGPIIVRCAEAGKHLYLDKSLAPQLSEVDAIRAATLKAKVRSHMFSFVSQPWAAEAKQLVASGKLGKLLAIHADCFFAKGRTGTAKLGTPRKEEFPPRRHQLIEAKREFDNVGVYPITLIHWLTGQKFAKVHGLTANYFFAEHQKHDVEDFGLLSGTLEDGLPVTVAGGRCGWTTHPGFGFNQLLLVGSEGTALIDANRPRLEVCSDEAAWTPPNVNPEDPMGFWSSTQAAVHLRPKWAWSNLPAAAQSDAAYFLDRLDADQDSDMSVTQASHAAEVLLATYLSASKGEVVELPLKR